MTKQELQDSIVKLLNDFENDNPYNIKAVSAYLDLGAENESEIYEFNGERFKKMKKGNLEFIPDDFGN